ncbi:MAG: hypothetical protein L3J50_07405 [Emcibacter sp.]|nr:hypothetical protein [Emcibacter sp.]
MTREKKITSYAQLLDSLMHKVAIAFILMIIIRGIGLSEFFISPDLYGNLYYLKIALKIGLFLLILPVFINFLRLKFRGQCNIREEDSYISETFKRACVMSFALSILFLQLVKKTAAHYTKDLPTPVYIGALEIFSLSVFCITYFYLIYSESREDQEDDFTGEQDQ